MEKPCGLNKKDTLEDALSRADSLATGFSYSGQMVINKDLRRIVLLAWEYRKASQQINPANSKIAVAD